MQKNIIIIGNSSAALECYGCVQEILAISSFFTLFAFKGFLSHKGYTGNLKHFSSLELGSDSDYMVQENDVFVLGIGDNKLRQCAYEEMKSKNGIFMNLISPSVYFGESVQLGEANTILKKCNISDHVVIGNANYLNGDIIVGHDVEMGNHNFIAPRTNLLGNVKIGDSNKIATNSMLLDKVKIGNNNTIAPTAVVYKGCKDNALMAGNPAVKIGTANKEILA